MVLKYFIRHLSGVPLSVIRKLKKGGKEERNGPTFRTVKNPAYLQGKGSGIGAKHKSEHFSTK